MGKKGQIVIKTHFQSLILLNLLLELNHLPENLDLEVSEFLEIIGNHPISRNGIHDQNKNQQSKT